RLLAELLRGFLVLLVLEQPADQIGARIDLDVATVTGLAVLVVERLGRGQELARLDVAQGRRHQQILTGDVDVEPRHRVEVLEVLLGDERDRDVEDRQLVLLDQVEQEVERALEDVEGNLVAGRFHGLPRRRTGGRTPGRRTRRAWSPATGTRPASAGSA